MDNNIIECVYGWAGGHGWYTKSSMNLVRLLVKVGWWEGALSLISKDMYKNRLFAL